MSRQPSCLFSRVLVVLCRVSSKLEFVFTCTGFKSTQFLDNQGVCFHVFCSFYAVFPTIRSFFSRVLIVLCRVSSDQEFVFTCSGRNSTQSLGNQGVCLPRILVVSLCSVSTIKVFVYQVYWSLGSAVSVPVWRLSCVLVVLCSVATNKAFITCTG